jgi:hypothetical protein
MASCTVSENNPGITDGDDRTSGEFVSSGIREQTIYTLSCDREGGGTFLDTAAVNILPVWEEPR